MQHSLTHDTKNEAELHVKKLQLHWLLQITKAINYNMPSEQLFQIYENVMRDQLKVQKMVLFVHEQRWQKMLTYGVNEEFLADDFEDRLSELGLMQYNNVQMPDWVQGFESIIPVLHDEKPLAYALIGNVQHAEIVHVKEVLPFIHTITNIIVVAIENKRLTRETIRQAQMEKELELAARMQSMLFPAHLPADRRIDLAATYLPHQQVGGDYYDYIQVSQDELLICLADVSGKGISAALLMSNFQANLHALLPHMDSLSELVSLLNAKVFQSAKGEKFITFFIGRYHALTSELHYVNAGHNPPFLIHEKVVYMLNEGSTGLGMFESLPFINSGKVFIPPNAMLHCYTDGVTDVENDAGMEFGMDRLRGFLTSKNQLHDMEELHRQLIASLSSFRQSKNYTDDITLLSCWFKNLST